MAFDKKPARRTGKPGPALGGPRRAVPPRGPIPPAREAEPRSRRPEPGKPDPYAPRPAQPPRSPRFAPRPTTSRPGQFAPQPVQPPRRPRSAPRPAPIQPEPPAPLFPDQGQGPEPAENLLVGRNPIREALKAGRPMEKLLVADGDLAGSAREIIAMARERHVIVQYVDRVRLDQVCKGHQGMVAWASAAEYASVEDLLALAAERDEAPLVVVLDGITDPHNLGAIIRTAECMGAHGVVVPERRAAGLVPAAVKAAAGALSYIKVARVVNLARTLESLKGEGLWIAGAVTDAPDVREADLSGPLALVIGSEGSGISALVRQKCDFLVSLPMYGQIQSLNASVAAGILLAEIARNRHA